MFLAIQDVLNWVIPIVLGLFIGYLLATRNKDNGNNIIYMEAEEFRANMRKGQLIDIRKDDDHKKEKINGSRCFPRKAILADLFKLRTDQAVFLYSYTDSGVIKKVAKKLVKKGYKPIYILTGGFDNWPFIKK